MAVSTKVRQILNKPIYALADQKWRDLNNKRVESLAMASFRPRARYGYVYFHYCIQVLRHILQQSVDDAVASSYAKRRNRNALLGNTRTIYEQENVGSVC
jgi:hypothetical protein